MNAIQPQQVQYNLDDVSAVMEDEFLQLDDLFLVKKQEAERYQRRVIAEMEELIRENKWMEVKEMFYPVEKKLPELVALKADIPIRGKLAFVLGQIKCFDEAIQELAICVREKPDHFLFHSSMAYTAYNSLYAAKNREIMLTGKLRAERIELAHKHFKIAQELRQDGVTNYYREGMLFKQIENKPDEAIKLFQKAVENWEKLTEAQKKERHQEQKNYIKSLYELASCLLHQGHPNASLEALKKCMALDESHNYISMMFKYFAMGKIYYHMNQFEEARNNLLFAIQTKPKQQGADFVYELLAKTYLLLKDPTKGLEMIQKIPENRRYPYIRWTEAEILCALKKMDQAKKTLIAGLERDRLSRHKTLIQLAKIEYLTRNYEKAVMYAAEADKFFKEKWNNHYDDGLFWQAISAFRMGDKDKAKALAKTLHHHKPFYPKLRDLMDVLAEKNTEAGGNTESGGKVIQFIQRKEN